MMVDVTTKHIEFAGSLGYKMAAKIELPDCVPIAYALFAPCFTCGKDIVTAKRICQRLARRGIAAMRIDFTGIGKSEGGFEETTFTSNVNDIITAAEYMAAHHQKPEILIGHSLGGTAMLAAAGDIDEGKCVITIGSPFDPAHVAHHFSDDIPRLKKEGIGEVKIMGRPHKVSYEFIEDLYRQDQADKISKLHKPLLVMHAPLDDFVGIENAEQIFSHARHPRSYISLDKSDHLLMNNPNDAYYAADMIAYWSEYYIEMGVRSLS